jgi:CMP-N-acetylneuraminic acid synthetase
METYWTNAENAAAMALRTAHAIAMETYWTSAENAAVTASPMAHATAMEMYWTSAENAAVTVSPMAHAIVKAMAQRLDTIAMMNAWSIRMEMESATSLR